MRKDGFLGCIEPTNRPIRHFESLLKRQRLIYFQARQGIGEATGV